MNAGYHDGEPVVVTAALTGGVHGKEANPNLPETPAEIGEAAAACERAGASVVHLHARRENGERAFSTDRFQQVADAVREATDDVILQHSTGGTAAPEDRRIEPIRTDPPPEMASLDMGPLNRYDHLTSENTRAFVDRLHDEMRERGIKPELEVFNDGHLNETLAFLDRSDTTDPPYLNLVFGGGTTSPPSPRRLLTHLDDVPDGAEVNVLGFGPHQLPVTTTSMLVGGHARVGLEDNVYYRQGEPATSNAQLVERTATVAEQLGRPVATTTEARSILGL
ncbi:MAG: 3-keto-5-aminohexanoate cleavage enzyme [uncultured archaeon A07HB70]|nr:MAG: 3-keto-5-aminohexanoate cleavage enzyme [uncultured archaeon A07HB70]